MPVAMKICRFLPHSCLGAATSANFRAAGFLARFLYKETLVMPF